MALKVEELGCVRGGRRVFAGATFDVPRGAFAQLTGRNGAGKSTLLRAVAGLLRSAGAASFDGASLREDREAYQEHVAYAGHLDAVKPSLTVRENLVFWAGLYGERAGDGAVEAALSRFRLERLSDAPAAYCSAGQKRRLGLARLTLATRPLWLLDEPTASLDAESAALVAELIAKHCRAGGVAVAATHAPIAPEGAPTVPLDMAAFAPTRGGGARSGGGPGGSAADDEFLSPFEIGADAR